MGRFFFTDELNNESYNSALIENKFNPIPNYHKRITRAVVIACYPEINDKVLFELIRRKQEYFVNNMSKIQTNTFLFDILKRAKKGRCVLWTSAERRRVDGIISEFDLQRYFDKIIFSSKKHIAEDIYHVCSELACMREQLLVFENDATVVKELQKNNISSCLFVRP